METVKTGGKKDTRRIFIADVIKNGYPERGFSVSTGAGILTDLK